MKNRIIFQMKFWKSNFQIPLIGIIIGAIFAFWDSFCDYLDTAPIREEILKSLWNSITVQNMTKIGVYMVIGFLCGVVIVLLYKAIQQLLYILCHKK